MPKAILKMFREADGEIPVQLWLAELDRRVPKAHEKCLAYLLELERLGYEADRPLSGTLRDGIHELRIKERRIHYRILYFFSGQNVIILSHCLIKKTDDVPEKEINKAIDHKKLIEKNASRHTTTWIVKEESEHREKDC